MVKSIMNLLILVFAFSAYAVDEVTDETRYNEFIQTIETGDTKSLISFNDNDSKLMVDALWDTQENGRVPLRLRQALMAIDPRVLSLQDQMRLAVLRHRVGLSFDRGALGSALVMGLADKKSGESLAYMITSLRKDLRSMGLNHVVVSTRLIHTDAFALALRSENLEMDIEQPSVARDLWYHHPDLASWSNGRYANGVRIYMFCRKNRDYPCLQLVRDARHEPVRLDDGSLWNQPALAKSARNIPSHQRNGHTPSSILTIDSVMPSPDQVPSFGKFRRLILNFIPKSAGEQRHRFILPDSSLESDWWKAGVVSRDVGRNLLRIHGTGRLNNDKESPWFPFRPTSGCVAKRENAYDDIEFRDQQNLLDTLMVAMDLEPKYSNETAIKGLFFLIEIDDKASAVTMDDLAEIGIN